MEPTSIFLPVSALVILTFVVLLLIPYKRIMASLDKKVTADDFAYGESKRVPGDVSLPNRNMMNLLEMPVLFYLLCLILFITGNVTPFFVNLAWVYFALRLAHSIVHLTYNKVLHRLACFGTSNLVLLVMWIQFIRILL
ncbi:MAG: MAPEG family protein [Gammaproteobacteria bacterium]|nr:MAPEG family protein [Pseudomonadales bacterium]MCP5347944.1 MAPEG family protein [Pseudomonadales bacterium]